MEALVHPTAVVDDNVQLGEGVKIWHFSHVSSGARIGAMTSLGQNVFVGREVRVGAGVRVQNNVSIYEGVEIADDAFLGPSCVFTNVFNPRSRVPRKTEFRRTRVGVGASIGANATIVCGHDIGAYAFVGAGAVVVKDVVDYAVVIGNSARHAGYMCRCGERLTRELSTAPIEMACVVCGLGYQIDAQGCRLSPA